jgi:hypothetical protein
MKKTFLFYLVIFLLLSVGVSVAQWIPGAPTTPTNPSVSTPGLTSISDWNSAAINATAAQYCGQLYSDSVTSSTAGGTGGQIVSNVFSGGLTGGGVLSLALLIVVMVLAVLAIVYGVGYGFGIRKMVEFAKTEYLESIFNIVLIVLIAGGFAGVGNVAGFFAGMASASSLSSSYLPPSNIMQLYSGICNNTIKGQVAPAVGNIAKTLLNLPVYTFLQSFTIALTPPAIFSDFSPGVIFKPLYGTNIDYQLIVFLLMPLFLTVFIGITVIFMFFLIYFLFPIFLYAGILLRSFPWTRAAGGALLALFIAFYIVLPVLYYPLLAVAAKQVSSAPNVQCSSQSLGGDCQTPDAIASSGWMNSFFGALGTLGSVFPSPTTLFIELTDGYVSFLAFAVLEFIGFGIALIISFDLLEALGDFLGAPSLQSGRLLERLI